VKIIRTDLMNPSDLSPFERDQVYNGLDCCVTHDVFAATEPQLDEHTSRTYALSKALQGPVLEMRIRGVLVDQSRRMEVIDQLFEASDTLERNLNRIVLDGLGLGAFNWRSHHDLQRLFYRELGIRPITKQGRPTTDRGAREKLELNPVATQVVKHINALTELGDKLSVLRTEIDPDGRIRTSYNIAGTSTGRFSSSLSEFGTGGNLQNVEESLRSIFIADPGWKFAKCDAKSGESYCVGAIEWNRFGDGTYLDACESGDPHTAAAKVVWPNLGWTGDIRQDKTIAGQPFYRDYSYRYMCKRLGHGSNYDGKPPRLSEETRVPIDLVTTFQHKYFAAFPAHRRWQADVDDRLRRLGCLVSLLGRKRWFFGRRTDPATLREAIAYDPQSSLRDIVSHAMLKIWREQLALIVMDDHDALTFMYREEDEDRLIPILLDALVIPIPVSNGRVLRIPYDAEVGWNKGHYSDANPDGLRAWTGHDPRKRQPIRNFLDTVVTRHLEAVK
jgi:DNA polymerase I-like protein with 3'-5' exonuclease and polymerase domains